MKHQLIIALLAIGPICAIAQENNVFVDLGLPLGFYLPGASVTYNWKPSKHFGIGAGAQEYIYTSQDVHMNEIYKPMPAIFADVRGYFGHKNQFLLFGDFGVDFYHSTYELNVAPHDNGLYSCLGFGYFRPIKNKAIKGGFMSLKFTTDSYKTTEVYMNETYTQANLDGAAVLSVGVKF